MDRVTVVGARGFIGGAVAARAQSLGIDVLRCRHDNVPRDRQLGTVIYCSGVAWDAEKRPLDAYDVHVASVLRLLENAAFKRLVYISSTRVYGRAEHTNEDAVLVCAPALAAETYAQSKISGEQLVLAAGAENRVVRLSNVYGASLRSQLFLSDVLRQAAGSGTIYLHTSLESSKDYVSVDDAAKAILQIAASSRERIYNVAAGYNTTHRAIIDALSSCTTVSVNVPNDAPVNVTPCIDVRRLRGEFGLSHRSLIDDLPYLVEAFRQGASV